MIVTRTAGRPVYEGTTKEMNDALTKIIKYFSRAVDAEALHFTDGTGAPPLLVRPSQSIEAPIARLPAEIWQDILLLALGSTGYLTFATTCTASTFLHFLRQERDPHSSYFEYMGCRATLRQVCRAWNEFFESTDTWWVHAEDPYHPGKSFGLPPLTDQVAIVKRLSMTIKTGECVGPAMNWASELFQRVQAPILSYNVHLQVPYDPNFVDEPYDPLAPVTTKMALRTLRIACRVKSSCKPISLSQINANFKDLVSLSLFRVPVHSTEELALPRLEFLSLSSTLPSAGWNLPRLRHVYIIYVPLRINLRTSIDSVRRYASQLESLFLVGFPRLDGFPGDFWESFSALHLLGLPYGALIDRIWGVLDAPMPPGHPFRYFVSKLSRSSPPLETAVRLLSRNWPYHDGVSLVVEEAVVGVYYLIEDVKQTEWEREIKWERGMKWRREMRETDGILPIHPPAMTRTGRAFPESTNVSRIVGPE